jgi:hypothetical protein
MLRRASPGRWPFFKLVKKREACKRFFREGRRGRRDTLDRTLSVSENPPGENSREALARKIKKMEPWMKQVLLAKNKVASEEDVYDLDRVILCVPDKA